VESHILYFQQLWSLVDRYARTLPACSARAQRDKYDLQSAYRDFFQMLHSTWKGLGQLQSKPMPGKRSARPEWIYGSTEFLYTRVITVRTCFSKTSTRTDRPTPMSRAGSARTSSAKGWRGKCQVYLAGFLFTKRCCSSFGLFFLQPVKSPAASRGYKSINLEGMSLRHPMWKPVI
jgi:hypothetical protein